MACLTLHSFTKNQYYFVSPLLKPKPKPQPQPCTGDVIYPQSLTAFDNFPVIGCLVGAEALSSLSMKELCDGLRSHLDPSSTWRLVPLPDGYYSLQFTCLTDQRRASAEPTLSLSCGTFSILPEWSPEFNAYRNIDTTSASCQSITSIRWRPPSPSWIKVNTDGSARGCPGLGPSSCGGVFRDSMGVVVGCFSWKLGSGIALETELSACIYAIEYANEKGWKKIWLESDSTVVVELLAVRSTVVPPRLKEAWMRVLGLLQRMEFQVSHIYREGNRLADALANPDAEEGCWPCSIPAISEFVYHDMIGCVNTRIRL